VIHNLDLSILWIGSQVRGGQESLCNCDGRCSGRWALFPSRAGLDKSEQYEPWCREVENRCSLGVAHREACPDQGPWPREEEDE